MESMTSDDQSTRFQIALQLVVALFDGETALGGELIGNQCDFFLKQLRMFLIYVRKAICASL